MRGGHADRKPDGGRDGGTGAFLCGEACGRAHARDPGWSRPLVAAILQTCSCHVLSRGPSIGANPVMLSCASTVARVCTVSTPSPKGHQSSDCRSKASVDRKTASGPARDRPFAAASRAQWETLFALLLERSPPGPAKLQRKRQRRVSRIAAPSRIPSIASAVRSPLLVGDFSRGDRYRPHQEADRNSPIQSPRRCTSRNVQFRPCCVRRGRDLPIAAKRVRWQAIRCMHPRKRDGRGVDAPASTKAAAAVMFADAG